MSQLRILSQCGWVGNFEFPAGRWHCFLSGLWSSVSYPEPVATPFVSREQSKSSGAAGWGKFWTPLFQAVGITEFTEDSLHVDPIINTDWRSLEYLPIWHYSTGSNKSFFANLFLGIFFPLNSCFWVSSFPWTITSDTHILLFAFIIISPTQQVNILFFVVINHIAS